MWMAKNEAFNNIYIKWPDHVISDMGQAQIMPSISAETPFQGSHKKVGPLGGHSHI